MFGFEDLNVSLAFLSLIVSTLAAAIYGIVNWNKGDEGDETLEDKKAWMKEEIALEEAVDGGMNS